MSENHTGKRCPACGLDLADCVRCTPAEVDRLTKDNERLMAKLDAACEMGQDSIKRGAEARAENKRLREALEPFAALLDPEEDWGAITIVDIGVRIEDVRAARVALEMEGER